MKKILILSERNKANDSLIKLLKNLFPETEICIMPKSTKDYALLQKVSTFDPFYPIKTNAQR